MSAAFVKENDYCKLGDVEPSLSALSFYLRQEYGRAVKETKSYFSQKCDSYVYEMSDGLTYALDHENRWRIILRD